MGEVETRVFSRQGEHEVERVYQLKRELIQFKRTVMPLGVPLLRMATPELPVVPTEAKAYFRSWPTTTPRPGRRWRPSTRC